MIVRSVKWPGLAGPCSKPVVAVRGLVRAKSIPSGLSLGATWWQHSTSASPSVGMTGDHVAGWLRAEKHYQVPKAFSSLRLSVCPLLQLPSHSCSLQGFKSLAPTSLTSCGLTVSLPCWPPHHFLAPLDLLVGTHTAVGSPGICMEGPWGLVIHLPGPSQLWNKCFFDYALGLILPLYFLPISPQR